jgi:hypothetical protein
MGPGTTTDRRLSGAKSTAGNPLWGLQDAGIEMQNVN